MPLYTFTHPETGAQLDIILPMAALRDELRFIRHRDTNRFCAEHDVDVTIEINHHRLDGLNLITLHRSHVPARVSTPRIVQSEYQASRVLRGYRELEDRGKLRQSSFTPDQVKHAWAMPDNPG